MLPKNALLLVFLVLVAGTTAMMIVLECHGAPLKTEGGYKIGALELARNSDRASTIVGAWREHRLLDLALEDIRFDYAFIALYTATLALACFYGSILWGALLGGWLGRAGTVLGWAMFVAGLMDVFENLGMTAEIGGNYAIAPLVCTVSSIKWIIAIAAALYSLPTLVIMLVRLPSLLRQDRMHRQSDRGRREDDEREQYAQRQ
ncbi:MAG TPA: hypothetical protein VLC46_00835 [Thermoanaerobaculia bacterium]|jgi:hypothetical protein|nr:hypothetical protein [Thermoanaerobaculia bacterium]